jgi:hypothetical protein
MKDFGDSSLCLGLLTGNWEDVVPLGHEPRKRKLTGGRIFPLGDGRDGVDQLKVLWEVLSEN